MDATGGRFHNLDSAWTPGLHIGNGTARAFTRAVASRCDGCLLEETTFDFLNKDGGFSFSPPP